MPTPPSVTSKPQAAKKQSSGILLFRRQPALEVLLAHPGGPYWEGTDLNAWSIPKGQHEPGEDNITAAMREFSEEVGRPLLASDRQRLIFLDWIKNSKGKKVWVWALEGDFDINAFSCNLFSMEWPKGSGRIQEFPEMDAAEWFSIPQAAHKIFNNQLPFLGRLEERLAAQK